MYTLGTCQVVEVGWLPSQKPAVTLTANSQGRSECNLAPDASYTPANTGHMLGYARSSFQMATLLNLLSGVTPFLLNKPWLHDFQHPLSSYSLSPVWTFLC